MKATSFSLFRNGSTLPGLFRSLRFSKRFSSQTPSCSTVFALSSGHGRCGVAVIRLSGPSCGEAVKKLCQTEKLPNPRYATLKRFYNPQNKELIDKGLVLWFPGPHSFTGEDCVEFQVHGGPAVVAAMLDTLGSLPGLRPAEPGDFTRRAFLAGKMDLTEVEGLGDLIHAETSAQRRQAVRQMEGDLGNLYSDWRRQILKCLADVEAFIDFSEDENIEEDTLERATRTIQKVTQELHSHLSDNRRGERLRDGVHVAIIGEPNVGKSSLLNALCQRPAAIVSPIPGTTRDVVETQINLAGYPVLLSDTAGLRETSDVIEKEGVQRALGRASKADLKVLVLDASTFLQSKPPNVSWARFVFNHMLSLGLTPANSADNQQLQSLASSFNSPCNDRGTEVGRIQNAVSHDQELVSRAGSYGRTILHQKAAGLDYFSSAAEFSAPPNKSAIASEFTIDTRNATGDSRAIAAVCNSDVTISKDVIVAVNKCDLLSSERLQCVPVKNQIGMDICRLSCTAAGGLDTFVSLLAARVKQLCGDPLADSPSITQSRHRTHLTQCLFHLDVYLQQVNHGDTVLAAQALRRAMRDLGRITGAVNVEDVLEVIFKDFCIGK